MPRHRASPRVGPPCAPGRALHFARAAVAGAVLLAGAPRSAAAQADPRDSGGVLSPEQAAYDVLFYELAIRVDPSDSTIDGALTVTARAVEPLDWLVLDLDPDLAIDAVRQGDAGPPAAFERRAGKVWVALPATRTPGETASVTLEYGGRPRIAPNPPWDGGFTWSATAAGAPWIATSCFGEGADLWWPVKDHPSDEPDSMRIRITVPSPLVAASNGRLVGVDSAAGWRTYHWFVSTPINSYDVALNIAPYRQIETTYRSVAGDTVPVTFWALPEHEWRAAALMPEIIDHLRFYERTLGPYPFRADKYGVAETPFLGMEHQSIIAYGAGFDNAAMSPGVDFGFDALHHHELSHEWWGNLVTNTDYRDLWLHEGFGTYMQPLYLEQRQGRTAYRAYLDTVRNYLTNATPVAPRESRSAKEVYGGDIYFKGAWILHTLRYLIGDEAMFTALRRMAYPDPAMERITDGRQTRFATTEDFIAIAEAAAGRKLGWFFEIYVRQPALPVLRVRRGATALELEWHPPGGLPFPMPVDVRVDEAVVRVDMTRGAGTVPAGADAIVEIDPDGWLLMEVERP